MDKRHSGNMIGAIEMLDLLKLKGFDGQVNKYYPYKNNIEQNILFPINNVT